MNPSNSLIFTIGISVSYFSSASMASNSAPSKSSEHGATPKKHSKPHWAYSGSEGPSCWGSLAKELSTYSTGHNQRFFIA